MGGKASLVLLLLTSLSMTSLVSALKCNFCHAGTENKLLCEAERECLPYEVCQNNYRLRQDGTVEMSKKCKQDKACYNEVDNEDSICKDPYAKHGICRCCCTTDNCNAQEKGCFELGNCRVPSHPENGRVQCHSPLSPGEICVYTCNEGYELVGVETRECTAPDTGRTGAYLVPEEEPTCQLQVKRCNPPLTAPKNGFMTCENAEKYEDKEDKNYPGSSCTFSCKENFELQGLTYSRCDDGQWTALAPICVQHECKPLERGQYRIDTCTNKYYVGTKCTFECTDGRKVIGLPEVECLEGGFWSNLPPRCSLLRCLPTFVPRSHSGTVTCTNENYEGSVCTFKCNYGYYKQGAGVATCEDDMDGDEFGKWNGGPPFCRPITCEPEAKAGKNSQVECTDFNYLDSVCRYTCKNGYSIVNSTAKTMTSKCTDDKDGDSLGEWSRPPPVCTEDVCEPPLQRPANGDMSCSNGNKANSRCTFTCDRGYDLDSTTAPFYESECYLINNKMQWTSPQPTCSPIVCPGGRVLMNGEISCNMRNSINSLCIFTCNEGFTMDGSNSARCEDRLADGDARGEWSAEVPTCSPIECVLPPMTYPLNRNCELVRVGSKCTYTCPRGHFMHDQNDLIPGRKLVSECLITGLWSTGVPFCEMITCKPLEAPQYGYTPACTSTSSYNSVCTFACWTDYKLSHKNPLKCTDPGTGQREGVWDPEEPPTCGFKQCEDFEKNTQITNGRIDYTAGNNVGSVGTLKCDPRYIAKRHTKIRCMKPNQKSVVPFWEPRSPVCCVRCEPIKNMRIIFALDETAARTGSDWSPITEAVGTILNEMRRGGRSMTVGVIFYDEVTLDTKWLDLRVIEGDEWMKVNLLEEEMKNLDLGSGGTVSNSGQALNFVYDEMLDQEGVVSDKYVVVMMGAKSKDDIKLPAKKLIDELGVKIIGISTKSVSIYEPSVYADSRYLDSVFGKDNTFEITNWNDLRRARTRIEQLNDDSCDRAESKKQPCP